MFSANGQLLTLHQDNRDVLVIIKLLFILAICAAGVGVFPSVYAESQTYYRWTDESGTTHYGLKPPENRPWSEVLINTHQLVLEKNKEKSNSEKSKKIAAADVVDEGTANKIKAQRRQQCDAQRARIAWLERKRLKRVREDGRLRILTRDDVAQRVADAKTFLKEACQ